ncbi:MAG: phosphatase PAP2 family protein [Chloroflexota bacterium]
MSVSELTTKSWLTTIKENDELIARWASHIISPHIVGIVLITLMTMRFSPNPVEVAIWLLIILPILVIPPLSYVLWLVRTGYLEDMYMPTRHKRIRPLAFIMSWFLVCWGLVYYWAAPPVVELLILGIMVLVGVLSIITFVWKISFHGASITAAITATLLVSDSYYIWPIMLLIPLVGWSRIRLNRHTPLQVVYGSLVGAVIAIILAYGILSRV